jgi:hypothetical protein
MTMRERNALRALQDRFIRLAKTWPVGFFDPLFGQGSPSIVELERFLYPQWSARMRDELRQPA